MPIPESVNPTKFTVERVLFNHEDFSVSYGVWNPTGNRVVAMRWNEGEDGSGYPKNFGYPQWFIVSDDIMRNVLVGLLNNSMLNLNEYNAIVETLSELGPGS